MHTTIMAIHKPYPDRLAEVIRTMHRRGPPVIRVADGGDHWIALEGSHRIAAAQRLGLPVRLRVMAPTSRIRHDFQDIEAQRPAVARLVDYLTDGGSPVPYSGLDLRLD